MMYVSHFLYESCWQLLFVYFFCLELKYRHSLLSKTVEKIGESFISFILRRDQLYRLLQHISATWSRRLVLSYIQIVHDCVSLVQTIGTFQERMLVLRQFRYCFVSLHSLYKLNCILHACSQTFLPMSYKLRGEKGPMFIISFFWNFCTHMQFPPVSFTLHAFFEIFFYYYNALLIVTSTKSSKS